MPSNRVRPPRGKTVGRRDPTPPPTRNEDRSDPREVRQNEGEKERQMKKLLMRRLAGGILFAAAMPIMADTETVGGYTWTYSINGGTAVIESVSPEPSGSVTIPSTLGGRPVTGIDVFGGCTALTDVAIPAGVTEMWESMFDGCDSLRSISVAAGNTSYKAVDGMLLTKDGKTLVVVPQALNVCGFNVPDSVVRIGEYAFESCHWLQRITLPLSVTNIGHAAFSGCLCLYSVTMQGDVRYIGDNAFDGCRNLHEVVVPSETMVRGGLTGAPVPTGAERAVAGYCNPPLTVALPASVEHVGQGVFSGCLDCDSCGTRQTRVTLPAWCKDIRNAYWDEDAEDYILTTGDVPASKEKLDWNGWKEWLGIEVDDVTISYKDVRVGGLFAAGKDESLDVEGVGIAKLVAAQIYDGYLYRMQGADCITAGTIQLKVGKPKAGTGAVKVSAKIQMPGGVKKSLKGAAIFVAGETRMEVTLAGDETCRLWIDDSGAWGTCGSYRVWASRNIFTSKDPTDRELAAKVLAKRKGTVNGAVNLGDSEDRGDVYLYSASVGAKGKVKLQEIGPTGKKVSAKGQLIRIGEGEGVWCALAMSARARAPYLIVVSEWDAEDGGWYWVEDAESEGRFAWPERLHQGEDGEGELFYIDDEDFPERIGGAEVARQLLPYYDDDSVRNVVFVKQVGTKWEVPKADKVALVNGMLAYGDNPSGLKLTYKAKNGSFKGAFSVYTVVNGKLKKTKATVHGVMVDCVGYGMAIIKGVGCLPIDIGGD